MKWPLICRADPTVQDVACIKLMTGFPFYLALLLADGEELIARLFLLHGNR